ncbi:hypothetical protein APHAL10511_005353 [Amanita phalloides]|nr:hypothetical protein APHAL10511_005353 [Amanita phalloides]
MASYFRSLFSSSGNRNKSQSKAHNRSTSASAIPAQTLSHVYAEQGTVPSIAIPAGNARERTNSNVAAQAITPSPLRYTSTGDPGSLWGKKNRPNSSQQQQQQQQQPNVFGSYSRHHRGSSDTHAHYSQPSLYQHQPSPTRPVNRSASHKGPERPPLYPLYTPNTSFSSVHSTSSSTSKTQSASCVRPVMPPRSSSATSVAISETREPKSALKRDSTWGGNTKNARAHVSFMNPNKPPTLTMHPLLAYSRLHRPPICFDVTYAPSSCTVLDRSTLSPVPPHTLTQPATEPPTYTRLVLRCDKLPWPVLVTSPSENAPSSNGSANSNGGTKFYVGGSSSSVNSHTRKNSGMAITNLDILFALHNTLSHRVTPTEWEGLGQGSRAQRKATRAYEKRCQKMGGGWQGGVRRLDFLGPKVILVGIELDKTSTERGATGKLVVGKP